MQHLVSQLLNFGDEEYCQNFILKEKAWLARAYQTPVARIGSGYLSLSFLGLFDYRIYGILQKQAALFFFIFALRDQYSLYLFIFFRYIHFFSFFFF